MTILNSDDDVKDILVRVQETVSCGLKVLPGINAKGEIVVKLVFEERNFDPLAVPTCMNDIVEGRAFRGGGLKVRVTLLELTIVPCPVPFLQMLDDILLATGALYPLDDWRR